MRHIDKPYGCFIDRYGVEPELESVDIGMTTLDAENFLEKSLYSIYKEIPVRKLFICDGDSKDKTLNILQKFPRVEIHIKPEFKTTGKALEFLISLMETDWIALIDSDIELSEGWYDKMSENKSKYDALENSRRVLAYHFYREDKNKLDENQRAGDICHMLRRTSVQKFHCDDDYMWRMTDYFLRQIVESSGFKYGKIDTTMHVHNETEGISYPSDEKKIYKKLVFREPEVTIVNQDKYNEIEIQRVKAIIKYLDPESTLMKNDKGIDSLISMLDKEWIIKNGPKWLERYNRGISINFKIKKFIYNIIHRTK